MSIIYTNFVGIDIGKEELVMNIYGNNKTYSYKNNLDGLAEMHSEHNKILAQALIVLEATGGYERNAISFLQSRNIAVHRANGRQIKNFIRSLGIIAKNDNIDAKALSRYCKERSNSLAIYRPCAHDHLRELIARRDDLVSIRTQEKNRLQAPHNFAAIGESCIVIIKALSEGIAGIERQISEYIASNEELQEKMQIAQTVDGVGEKTAWSIICNMPEIGNLSQKQVASLAGVAPHPNQSGGKDGYRRTRGGRRKMRCALFMAALSITRIKKGKLKEFYDKLIANGKPKMVALVAVMRKMIVICNARIKEAMLNKQKEITA